MLPGKEVAMGYDGSLKFDTKIDESGFNTGIGKISSIAKKGLAVTAAAVAGTAAAFGAVTKQALDSVAKLEQNVGGIETLFKKSASDVIKNANNAYKTAGISANSYMQNVTSFSAALLQGLGGDTKKAADMADMAMRDMSDNANKMGTDMETIIQTYQSLSRGNYAMLDNLKLGYGGTKKELERLIQDAAKFDKSVDANSTSYANIVKAVHAVQKEMGITGTTAKEASTTIEGSMNAAKAAWDNFLNGSGDASQLADTIEVMMENIGRNLGEIIPRLAKTIPELVVAMAPGMTEAGGKIVSGMCRGIEQNTPVLLAKASRMVSNILNGIIQAIPNLVKTGNTIVKSLGDGISSALPGLIPKTVEILAKLALGFIQAMPQMITTGIQIITSLAQGIINSIPLLIEYIPQIINRFCAAFDTGLFQIIGAGIKIIGNLVVGIVQAIPTLISALPQIALAIFNVFTHINLFSAGKALITNLKNGILSTKEGLLKSFGDLTKSIWNKITTTNWLKLGSTITSKLSSGIKSLAGKASGAAKTVAMRVFNTIQSTNWLDLGRKIVSKIVSGLLNLAGKMVSTAKSLGTKAVNAFKEIKWSSVGSNIVKGIIGGIGSAAGALYSKLRNLAGNALSAAKKKLGIKSPSRVFKKEVGKHIVTGIIAGINSEQKSLNKKITSLCNSAINSAKNASAKGNYSDIGKSLSENIASSVDSSVEKMTNSGKSIINKQISIGKDKDTAKYDKTISKLNKEIKKAKKDGKSTKALEKKLKKVKASKAKVEARYTALGKSMINSYTSALKKQAESAVSSAEAAIESLSDKFQEKYDSIVQNQSNMIDKMRSAGSLYDLDGNIKALEEYQNRLKSLKSKLPDSLMQEIYGMDIADANDYMEYLQKMDPKKLQDYINKWNKIYNGSEAFGNDFFKSDLQKLQENYSSQLNSELRKLKTKLNNLGKNAMAGFTAGMKSQSKNMSKAVRQMCDQIIKDMKKKLKIHSPSREVRDKVAKYLPLGMSSGFSKYLPKATSQMEKDLDKYLSSMKTKVASVEYQQPNTIPNERLTKQSPVVVVKDERPVEVSAEIHTTVDVDGRTLGKVVTPYVDKNLENKRKQAERRS